MSHAYRMNGETLRAIRILRAHRRRLGLSPEQLAKTLGVSRSTVYNWENGRLSHTAVRLINFLANDIYEADGDVAGHGAFYWRERAFIAETTLRRITEYLIQRKDEVDALNGTH